MEALWIFSGTPSYFSVPHAKFILDEGGGLAPHAFRYSVVIRSLEDFCLHIERVKIVVLVAEDKLIPADVLSSIPVMMPKLVIITDNSPAVVRQQINATKPEGYLFGKVTSVDFSEALDKAYSDKVAVNHIYQELQKYTDIAFTAMSSASEMGVAALFAERAQSVMDISRLAQLTLNCFKDLGVEGVVQFSFDNEVAVYPDTASAAHKQLLDGARTTDSRIISHGRFLVFSFTHVQLLITDAPFDDTERYGRLRDVIAPIVSIAEARLKTLKVNKLLKEHHANTVKVMMLLKMASSDNRDAVKVIMTELSFSLREMATGLELTLAQENALTGLSEGALESLERLHVATGAVENHFRSLLEQLDVASSLLHVGEAEDADIRHTSNVELF